MRAEAAGRGLTRLMPPRGSRTIRRLLCCPSRPGVPLLDRPLCRLDRSERQGHHPQHQGRHKQHSYLSHGNEEEYEPGHRLGALVEGQVGDQAADADQDAGYYDGPGNDLPLAEESDQEQVGVRDEDAQQGHRSSRTPAELHHHP